MKKVGYIILGICLLSCLQACSEANNVEHSVIDIDSEHIQHELTEKIHIDADITPYDRYKQGMTSYYIESYIDMKGVFDENSLVENAQFFKQDIDSVIGSIEDNSDGTFDMDNMNIIFDTTNKECEFNIKHTDSEGIERALAYIWYIDDEGNAYSPEVWFDCRNGDEGSLSEHYLGRDVKTYIPEYLAEDLLFAKADESGILWKKNIENIIGEELSNNYVIVSVSEENYNELVEMGGAAETIFDEEFYQFFYFRSVDGFSWKRLECSIPIESAGEISSDMENQILGNYLMPKEEWPLIVDVDENGIRFMELSVNNTIGEVYKEKTEVIDLNQLIEKVEDYFSIGYIANDITIYNMELCYSSSFSGKEHGKLKNIVAPYWIVDYRVDKLSGRPETWRIVFDAYTGEFIGEKEAVE